LRLLKLRAVGAKERIVENGGAKRLKSFWERLTEKE
jgi:hypothetical protein